MWIIWESRGIPIPSFLKYIYFYFKIFSHIHMRIWMWCVFSLPNHLRSWLTYTKLQGRGPNNYYVCKQLATTDGGMYPTSGYIPKGISLLQRAFAQNVTPHIPYWAAFPYFDAFGLISHYAKKIDRGMVTVGEAISMNYFWTLLRMDQVTVAQWPPLAIVARVGGPSWPVA